MAENTAKETAEQEMPAEGAAETEKAAAEKTAAAAPGKKDDILTFRGHPLMRKGNIVYYGSMSDRYIVMIQILETREVRDLQVATRVSVQLQQTSPSVRPKDRIVKKTEKKGLYDALDIGYIWLKRALSAK